jgi:hypothetical protein
MVTTVGDFVAGDLLEVIGRQSVPLDAHPVEQVTPCGPGWRLLHSGRAQPRRFLALIPAEDAPAAMGAALRELARQGAVAAALTGDAAGLDLQEVLQAAAGADLVVLAAPGTLNTAQVAGALMHRQTEVYRRRTDIARSLYRLTGELHRKGAGPRRLLDYIQRETGAQLDILTRGGVVWDELAAREPYLDQLADGAIAVKAYETDGPPTTSDAAGARGESFWQVSLHALQGVRPHPVLYARAPGALSPDTLDLIEQTAVQASMLHETVRRREAATRDADNRATVLQYLLLGEITTATRAGERMAPGVLTRETGRMAIIECGLGEDRAEVSEACTSVVDPALIAPCPAYERHLILALPGDEDDDTAQTALSQLAEAGRAIGISTARPWPRTVLSYQGAFRALTAARHSTTRTALNESEPVAALLPPQARAWGRALQARIASLPNLTLHTAQIALAHGDTQAGKLMGVRRTTAGTRLSSVMSAMGLVRGSLAHRAVADLALQLASLPTEDTEDVADVGEVPELAPVLTGPAARAWAQEYLEPLDEHHLRVLTAWLAADGQITTAAGELGAGRNTVARWLDQAGARLSRALRDPGEGPHDPLWALLITGHLPTDVLPATTPVPSCS